MTQPPNEALALPPAEPASASPTSAAGPLSRRARWFWAGAGLLALLSVAAVGVAWMAQQRVHELELELVRRQQNSMSQSTEANVIAKQAQDQVRETAGKVALLEARVAEVAIQRSQLEELIQSLSRSRDENILGDVEAAIRVAMQQTAISGSAEPLVGALRQADERLARYDQPRLEGVRRAIARDLDRVRAAAVADLPTLGIKLDEAVRLVDELPLVSVAEPRRPAPAAGVRRAGEAATPAETSPPWLQRWKLAWAAATERVWSEVKSLVRVTRIDHPEAMLVAPEQAYFLRENLKLRLLTARLSLMSRQYDTAQADLQGALRTLERYFEKGSRRTVYAAELIRQVAAQARHGGVPRPDDTLAALAAAVAGR